MDVCLGGLLVIYVLNVSKFRVSIMVSFFFQAEDGIRDYKVTGVQTCALPIYVVMLDIFSHDRFIKEFPEVMVYYFVDDCKHCTEIGRASCRERV